MKILLVGNEVFTFAVRTQMANLAAIVLLLINCFVVAKIVIAWSSIIEKIIKWIYVIDLIIILIYVHVAFLMLYFFPGKLSPKELPIVSFAWYLLFFLNGLIFSISMNLFFKLKKRKFPFIIFALLTFIYEFFIGLIIITSF